MRRVLRRLSSSLRACAGVGDRFGTRALKMARTFEWHFSRHARAQILASEAPLLIIIPALAFAEGTGTVMTIASVTEPCSKALSA